jgi:large subunit ribosomal protein L30
MSTIRIQQYKSGIDRPKRQKDTLIALGFKKNNQIIEHNSTPQILGMLNKVKHLVKVI